MGTLSISSAVIYASSTTYTSIADCYVNVVDSNGMVNLFSGTLNSGSNSITVPSGLFTSRSAYFQIGTSISGGSSASSGNGFQVWIAGTYTLTLNIVDVGGVYKGEVSLSLTVDNYLSSVTVTPDESFIDTTESVTLTATAGSGGSGSFTYQWYQNGAAISGATSATYVISGSGVGAGVDFYYVDFTDTATYNTHITQSNSAVAIIYTPMLLTSYQNVTYLQTGEPIQLGVNTEYGSGSFAYQWYINSATVSGAVGLIYLTYPSTVGTYTAYCAVTDNGISPTRTVNAPTITYYVVPPMSAATNIVSGAVAQGVSIGISVTASGGSGSFSYQWYTNAGGGSFPGGSTVASTSYSSTTDGVNLVWCQITDGDTHAVYVTADIVINVIGTISVQISPLSLTVAAGASFTIAVSSVSGGAGPYSYSWSNGMTGPSITLSEATAGSYSFYVTATDSTGVASTSSTATVTVLNGLAVSITCSPLTATDGTTVSCTSSVSGGAAGDALSYDWYNSQVSGVAGTATSYSFTYVSGMYTIYLVVDDTTHNLVGQSASVAIVPPQSVSGTVIAVAVSDNISLSDSVSVQHLVGPGTTSGTVQPTNQFDILLNGTVLPTVYNISLDRGMGKAGELQFTAAGTVNSTVAPIVLYDQIEFGFMGKQMFYGYVLEVTKNPDATYDVIAYDAGYVLGMATASITSAQSLGAFVTYIVNSAKQSFSPALPFGNKVNSGIMPSVQFINTNFNNTNLLSQINSIATAVGFHIIVDSDNNVNLLGVGTSVRTITENSGGAKVIAKRLDTSELYNQIAVTAYIYNVAFHTSGLVTAVANASGASYFSPLAGVSTRTLGGTWLQLVHTQISGQDTPLSMAQTIYNQYKIGVWRIQIWTPWASGTQYSIADVDSSGMLYNYTINFADGSSLSGLIMTDIHVDTSGVTYTFQNADDSWAGMFQSLVASSNTT